MSQFHLLGERRFGPLFWTQFLGAANDNLFKFAFTLLATYHAAQWGGVDPATAGFVIGAIFIAPFVLFSATSGQLADKIEKGERLNVGQIVEVSTLSRSAVSHHLKLLRDSGVLQSEKIGKEVWFWVNKPFLEQSLSAVMAFIRERA